MQRQQQLDCLVPVIHDALRVSHPPDLLLMRIPKRLQHLRRILPSSTLRRTDVLPAEAQELIGAPAFARTALDALGERPADLVVDLESIREVGPRNVVLGDDRGQYEAVLRL